MTEPTATDDRDRHDEWAATVQALAGAYSFPPTPNVAGPVRQQLDARRASRPRPARPAWQRPALVFALLLLLLALALSVPAVRAALRDWLQIGAVRIVVTPPAGMAAPPTGEPAHPLFGELVTLDEARAAAGFRLRLPTVAPADRPPDRIYVQDIPDLPAAQAVIAVWEDEQGRPALSLYQIEGPHYGTKVAWANALVETEVGGELAYWVEGPHPLLLGSGERWSVLSGDVLTWTDNVFTYRLESTLPLEDALRIAESLP